MRGQGFVSDNLCILMPELQCFPNMSKREFPGDVTSTGPIGNFLIAI